MLLFCFDYITIFAFTWNICPCTVRLLHEATLQYMGKYSTWKQYTSEATLKGMGKTDWSQTTTSHSKAWMVCKILGTCMHCTTHIIKKPLKWKGRQDDCPDHYWGCWRQASTSPVKTRAAVLMTFLFLWIWKPNHHQNSKSHFWRPFSRVINLY